MKNMFGEEVGPRKLTTEWRFPRLEIFVDGKYQGNVYPNGFRGHAMNLHYKFAEPILDNLQVWSTLSLPEMKHIMEEYYKNMTNERAIILCTDAVAQEKKITYDEACELLQEKNIPIIDP